MLVGMMLLLISCFGNKMEVPACPQSECGERMAPCRPVIFVYNAARAAGPGCWLGWASLLPARPGSAWLHSHHVAKCFVLIWTNYQHRGQSSRSLVSSMTCVMYETLLITPLCPPVPPGPGCRPCYCLYKYYPDGWCGPPARPA